MSFFFSVIPELIDDEIVILSILSPVLKGNFWMSFCDLIRTLFCLISSPNNFSIAYIDFTNLGKYKGVNPSSHTILDNWVFDNFMSANESFAKALQSLNT